MAARTCDSGEIPECEQRHTVGLAAEFLEQRMLGGAAWVRQRRAQR